MSDPKNLDDARHGGGIGDIGRQPIDQSSENVGNASPSINSDDAVGRIAGTALARDEDAAESDDDLDGEADDTQGQPL